MRGRSLVLALAAAAMVAAAGSSARAGGMTLQELINNNNTGGTDFTLFGGVVINVSNVSYATQTNTGSTIEPGASGITVSATTLKAGGVMYAGLNFGALWQASGVGGTLDDLLKFTVTVVTPGQEMSNLYGSANLAITQGSTATATLSESVVQLNNNPPTSVIPTTLLSPTNPSFEYGLIGGPYSSIQITKDLTLTSNAAGDVANLSTINQLLRFSAVPEPNSMALLGIGLSTLIALRRFFRYPAIA